MELKSDLQQKKFFIVDLCSKSVLKNDIRLLAGLPPSSSKANEISRSCSKATYDHKTSLTLKIASVTSGEIM